MRSVVGGLLVQDADRAMEDPAHAQVVTQRAPTDAELRAMRFGLKVVKHVKSNAIAFVGAGPHAGARRRRDLARRSGARRARQGRRASASRSQGSVLASDAFFPFPDGVEEAAAAGATAIVQPGGSVRDDEVIAAADRRTWRWCSPACGTSGTEPEATRSATELGV